jgi:DNA-binding CsgD family transcriptional regulator
MSHNKFSDEQLINLLVNKKMTDRQVANELRISRNTVAAHRRKLNIPIKNKNPSWKYVLTTEQETKIQSLYVLGKNDYEVCEETHIGRARLRKWRQLHGIKSQTNKKGLTDVQAKECLKQKKLGKTFKEISQNFNVNPSSIRRLLHRFGYDFKSRNRPRPVDIENYKLTPKQLSVLIGDLFGDGNIASVSDQMAYYQCSHKTAQESFVVWKFNILKPLSNKLTFFDIKNPLQPDADRKGYFHMSTWSTRELKFWRDQIYPSGKGNKNLTVNLAKLLDPIGLAVWYMGDGSLTRNRASITAGVYLDMQPIVDILNLKFGNLLRAKLYEKQWTIFIEDNEKFFKLVGQYIIPNMVYKVPVGCQKYCVPDLVDFGYIYGNADFTKKKFSSLSFDQKSFLVEDTVQFYLHRGFPYPKYSEEERHKDFMLLMSHNAEVVNGVFKPNMNIFGNKLCNHFFSHRFNAKRYHTDALSIWGTSEFSKFIETRYKNFRAPFSDSTIRTGISLRGLPRNFNPAIAKYIYNNYLPDNGSTLDFSAGYGGRLLGYLACGKGSKYAGVEPLSESFLGLNRLAEDTIRWTDLSKETIKFIHSPFEKLTFEENFDLIFSSPPFFGLEIYGNEDTQSIEQYPKYNLWLENFWFKTLKICYDCLKLHGYLIFSLSNYLKYNIIEDTIQFLKNFSLVSEPALKVYYHNVFLKSDKSETIFIFRKSQ